MERSFGKAMEVKVKNELKIKLKRAVATQRDGLLQERRRQGQSQWTTSENLIDDRRANYGTATRH
jgi:hypothetical protein